MKVCFNGCSFTVGEGFDIDQREVYIYDRLLEKKFQFNRTNIAYGGSSNYTIFMRSAQAILAGEYDVLVTQWTAMNRLWLYPGPDTEFFVNDYRGTDYNYRHIYINAKDKKKLKDTLLVLNGDYHNILYLITFTRILTTMAQTNSIKLVFVNGLVPWQNDLVTPLTTDLSSSLSEYSKQILDFDNRNDSEIIKFFQNLQQSANNLDLSLWVNPFNSWKSNIIDVCPQGHHPGIQSHKWMADLVSKHFVENQIL